MGKHQPAAADVAAAAAADEADTAQAPLESDSGVCNVVCTVVQNPITHRLDS